MDSDDACGDPVEYPAKSLHPSNVRVGESARQLELRPLTTRLDGGEALPRSSVLIVTDGSPRTPGDAVRLRNALRSLTAGSEELHRNRVAVLQGSDRLLGRLWRRRGRLGAALAATGYRSAIGPGFSTWADHTPWQSLVATSMSISVAADLSRHLPTVPTLVWRNHEDLDRLASWVRDCGLRHIALHPGALRGAAEWAWWLEGVMRLRELLAEATPLPNLLVTGPCAADRIIEVLNAWPADVTFVTQHPWELAIHGKALQADLGDEVAAPDESVPELLEANSAMFRRFIDSEVHRLGATCLPPHARGSGT